MRRFVFQNAGALSSRKLALTSGPLDHRNVPAKGYRKPKSLRKEHHLRLRLTAMEYAQIEAAAQAADMSVSEWAREVLEVGALTQLGLKKK